MLRRCSLNLSKILLLAQHSICHTDKLEHRPHRSKGILLGVIKFLTALAFLKIICGFLFAMELKSGSHCKMFQFLRMIILIWSYSLLYLLLHHLFLLHSLFSSLSPPNVSYLHTPWVICDLLPWYHFPYILCLWISCLIYHPLFDIIGYMHAILFQ